MTARRIAQQLRLARSAVAAVLKRGVLNRLKLLEPKEPIRRYERKRPGELIHLDIKKLGRIRGVGHRITGNRQGPRHTRTRPNTPKTSGKAERFIQTPIREWAYGWAYQNSTQRINWLPKGLNFCQRLRENGGSGFPPPTTCIGAVR